MKIVWKTAAFLAIGVTLLALSCNCVNQRNMFRPETVKEVDINRYMGVWYEIARFPHRFERDLTGVTATYTLRDDGKIDVLNEGYKHSLDGKHRKTRGKARVPDKSQPGKLKVTFFIFGADYYILELDKENYTWALVGSSSPNYLWILGRRPQMEDDTYTMLVEKARQHGYDISLLIKVEQKK